MYNVTYLVTKLAHGVTFRDEIPCKLFFQKVKI